MHGNLQQRRQQLAQETARLIAEEGHADFAKARHKAALRLGIREKAALPDEGEIRAALHAHQRLFAHDENSPRLQSQYRAALAAMHFFAAFKPRLAGPLAAGIATGHLPVCLHLHSDNPEEVAIFLHEHGIPADAAARRLRLNGRDERMVDVWQFIADGQAFELVVLPIACLQQAPREGLAEKPGKRLDIKALQARL